MLGAPIKSGEQKNGRREIVDKSSEGGTKQVPKANVWPLIWLKSWVQIQFDAVWPVTEQQIGAAPLHTQD